ncbi:hypothetical protein Pla52n_39110 [Stieleria varia]|uniref:Uncharacterized protein n=1 Tax=Stieleria varia TaxID=2528005 RepID=A0A5C6ATV1_9BACT|nr:hypothetical protein Pla52n_39110 [Stieleria varia]
MEQTRQFVDLAMTLNSSLSDTASLAETMKCHLLPISPEVVQFFKLLKNDTFTETSPSPKKLWEGSNKQSNVREGASTTGYAQTALPGNLAKTRFPTLPTASGR